MAFAVRKASDLKPSMKRHRDVSAKQSGQRCRPGPPAWKHNDGHPDESGISEVGPVARGSKRVANSWSKPTMNFA